MDKMVIDPNVRRQVSKDLKSINPSFDRVFNICCEGLQVATETLRQTNASRVISLNNVAHSGVSRRIDVVVEKYIVSQLAEQNIQTLSEESGLNSVRRADKFAILDPIDGTSNAIRGTPFFSISLAMGVLRQNKIFMSDIDYSVVCSPIGVFYAIRGVGAFQNGNKIKSSEVTDLKNAILRIPKKLDFTISFLHRIESLLNLGCTSLEMCMVANGSIDCYIETKKRKIFDYAGALLIVREAGGVSTSLANASISPRAVGPHTRSSLLVAANQSIHRKVLNAVSKKA